MTLNQNEGETKVPVKEDQPSSSTTEGSGTGENKGRRNGSKFSRGKVALSQGYDYKGVDEDIGVILGLSNERFGAKVDFTSFTDKLKIHVLTNFTQGEDVVPILESLTDPMKMIEDEEPKDLTEAEAKSVVKQWMKQEEVKLHVKRIKTLESNKKSLYATVWGQMSTGLQEIIKGDSDFIQKDKVFDCIWLLGQAKLASAGVDTKANKHCTLIQALTHFCTLKQGVTESNDSFRKRVDSATLMLDLAGGLRSLCSSDIMQATNPSAPTEEEITAEIDKVKAIILVLRADPVRYGGLQESLFDAMYKLRDEFPKSTTKAYDLLQNSSNDISKYTNNRRFSRYFSRRGNNNSKQHVNFAQTNIKLIPGKDGKIYSHVTCHGTLNKRS